MFPGQRRLGCIAVLQCLSTFYVKDAFSLSTISYRMISDYTGLSMSTVQYLISYLSAHGYVDIAACTGAVRLDPDTWFERSSRCTRKLYFAYFVSNAPACLRDKNSLVPQSRDCPIVLLPDYVEGCCSVTVASNFNAVYNTYTNRESCCRAPPPDPIEYIFEPKECLCDSTTPMQNLWYLRSVCSRDLIILFRRQLLVLYGSGYNGTKGSDFVDNGNCICILLNDHVIDHEESVDLLAFPECEKTRDANWESYKMFNGCDLFLDTASGIAYVGNYCPYKARLYHERGTTGCGTRFIEVNIEGSGCAESCSNTRR